MTIKEFSNGKEKMIAIKDFKDEWECTIRECHTEKYCYSCLTNTLELKRLVDFHNMLLIRNERI